ncbi:Follistatin- protein 1, partial [Characodon lateralis]|nr:Follistatin- protein 1 [Characodon lateralis]
FYCERPLKAPGVLIGCGGERGGGEGGRGGARTGRDSSALLKFYSNRGSPARLHLDKINPDQHYFSSLSGAATDFSDTMWRSVAALLLLAVALCKAEELQSKSKVCANVFCGAGRECTVNEKGEPSCLCIESCKPHKRSVCGSNGKTYRNHCELHRDACLSGLKIQVAHDGHCREKKTDQSAASPVVCYAADRNELRGRVIQWLQTEVVPDGWFAKGSNLSEVLLKYFKALQTC